MTDRSEKIANRVMVLIVASAIAFDVFLLASGCGGSQKFSDQAGKALGMSLQATTAARDTFISWDKAHQLALVDSSATQDEAEAKLASYRAQRQNVEKAFMVAYHALAAASSAIAIVELGGKPDRDLVALVGEAIKAVLEVKSAIDAISADTSPPPKPAPLPPPSPEPEGVPQ